MEKNIEHEMGTVLTQEYMAISKNTGAPIWTSIYHNPYFWEPQNGHP